MIHRNYYKEHTFTKRVCLGATFLALVVLYFVGQGITQLGMTSPYTLRDNSVSELGVTSCGPFENPLTHQTVVACGHERDIRGV